MRLKLPNLALPRPLPRHIFGPMAFAVAAALSFLCAGWAANVVERRSAEGVEEALVAAGHDWAHVLTNGLQVTLSGTAPTEAARFRALSMAGTIVDADRLADAMDVADAAALTAPEFAIEILRNGDGISLIGLVPTGQSRDKIVEELTAVSGEGAITDMLESASHATPEGWDDAVAFGISALAGLPRSKISISAGQVSVTAISDSAAEKARMETNLTRKAPAGLRLLLDISAPRPVITPFTLRFLVGETGARFDACSADSEQARSRILSAATDAGATGKTACTIGLGVPTPAWADAVTMGIAALKELGAGSVTYSDADISLIAGDTVDQSAFDLVVGELESNLPEVFSLHATLTPKPEATAIESGIKTFVATLSPEGRLDLRGRLSDTLSREAIESFAQARFGSSVVHTATRLDPDLPSGWPLRVLAALEALGEMQSGSITVQPDIIRLNGVTGDATASDAVARILSDKLGEGQQFDLSIRYDERLDPLLGLPTDKECAAEINTILTAHKINFEPGSATIAPDARETLDKIAERMKQCSDFPMEIGGHTDSQGREEMNQSLSQERAQAIVTALMNRRVLTSNLTAIGYGETLPIGDNQTEAGREANRRIEFRLLQTLEPETASESPVEEGAEATAESIVVGEPVAPSDGGGDAVTEPTEPVEDLASPVTIQTPDSTTTRPKQRPASGE
ncbi:MAG: OmpA family protein [Albidovulum sp.]